MEGNIRLIWVDKSRIDSEIESKLLKLNPTAKFFTDNEESIDFIKSIINGDILIIISYEIAFNILPSIHSCRSVKQIFVYNNEEKGINESESMINEYPKIVGIYTNKNELVKSIEEKARHVERFYLSFDLFDQKQKSTRDLSKESASFLWHQMLIHILKQIPQNDSSKSDMLNKCSEYYQTNQIELNKIEEFRNNYTRDKAMSWYTDECFLYKLVNRALRTEDIQLLYLFRYFIIDFCFELERENQKIKNNGIIKLYRGQIISNEEFQKLEQNIGILISTNGFFSTSRNINISLSFIKTYDKNMSKRVIFEITADPSIESVIFADISTLGSMPHEEEVLFSLNSLFKIDKIYFDSKLDVWTIEMTSTNEGIEKMNEYLKWIQSELDCYSPLIYFGRLLWNELNQINKALNYFQILLKTISSDHPDISFLYTELGNVYHEISQYNLAMEYYQKALNIRKQQIPLDYIRIASSLNNIGTVFQHQGQTDQALDYFQQSLAIFNKYYPNNEQILQKSSPLSNMGSIYRDKGDLNKSFELLTDAYNIRRNLLPNDHPLIANSLSNLGNICYEKCEFDEALDYYKKALTIQEITSPDDHLNKANTIRNIGLIYQNKKDWKEALNYFNRALEIRLNILSNENHPDIALSFGDIGNIYQNLQQIDLALDYYYRQLNMEEKCLSLDHPLIIKHFHLILNTLTKNNQIDKAQELCKDKLKYLQNILGDQYENHSYVANIFILFANLIENNYQEEAEKYYKQGLTILENQNDKKAIEMSLIKMSDFYSKLNKFDQSLNLQFKLLSLQRESVSSDNEQIAYTLQNIAKLYKLNNEIISSIVYYQQSLEIFQKIFGSEHDQVKYIQHKISSIDQNNEEQDLLKTIIPDYDYRNKPTMTYEYAAKPSFRLSRSAFCILL